ncbi:MAG: DnaD domain protein [Chitinophagaceae bacterium]|nr:DnaD domain protein [Anaerolineae bacterium]
MTDQKPIFAGFSAEMWNETTRLPSAFFTELLPLVDDLTELKVLLFCFWALPQKSGEFPYLRRSDFLHHAPLMAGLGTTESENVLDAALDRAVTQGILLCAEVADEKLYFVNTPRGTLAIEQIKVGEFRTGVGDTPIEILPERPTIYKLYESNIGLLTPMIADELKDIVKDFPREWIEEALREAVRANARKIKYIRAVLDRWKMEGKVIIMEQDRSEENGKSYVSGEYADFIEHG